jgi:hypothetical protein
MENDQIEKGFRALCGSPLLLCRSKDIKGTNQARKAEIRLWASPPGDLRKQKTEPLVH